MKTLPITASDEEVRALIRHWIDLLAQGRFEDAVQILSPEVLPANGSVDDKEHERWTGELVDAVIQNYGLPTRWEGQDRTWKVVPVDEEFRQAFEKYLTVSRKPFTSCGTNYCGGVHVELPLDSEEGSWVSDLTARFFLREVEKGEMALVLEDIHVM